MHNIKKITKRDKDYVSGPLLHKAIKDWYESQNDEIPETICNGVVQICNNLGTKGCFRNYSYLEEMVDSGIVACISALREKKYDPYKYDNPFAYFTQIIKNEFIRYIKLEHKETAIKHKSLINHVIQSSLVGEIIELKDDSTGRIDNLINKLDKVDDKENNNE